MEDRIIISILLDLYGNLLTNKQKNIMELYFNEDLSLSEIAEINDTSRQATYDLIKRCHKMLYDYEEKLHLHKKNIDKENHIKEIFSEIDYILNEIDNKEVQKKLINIKNSLADI